MELRDDTRPLTARSIVASTLLGVRPSRLPARALVASGRLFGIAEGTVRTALSRMVAAGELTTDDGHYELAGPFLLRRERQDESRAGATRSWTGDWELAVVDAERRVAADRTALRQAMRQLRRAELREGVWLRPDNLDPDRLPEARAVVGAQCTTMVARPEPELAARLWDLEAWSSRAERLAVDLAADRFEDLADSFVRSATVLRHLQTDPLLPAELLPPGWAGPRLREVYEGYDAAFKEAWSSASRRAVA
ncbi:MAG TPA: PaaX family transcriptional regulator C-terminal domain-containing protein [Acidimicrobiales bacterium]|nr:PaaX family transcriptional regulator C-terminal domain-containing protein [Acidimicrobiales bacterium]